MVVKSNIKLIKSLQQKKHRTEHNLFVVEGIKSVLELLHSKLKLNQLLVTAELQETFASWNPTLVSEYELKKMSGLKSPAGVLGVFHQAESTPLLEEDWTLVLDDLRDPGNLGTVIRLCDWFGIRQLVCSRTTVDCYNPKVLQATMGSIARIAIHYTDLSSYLKKTPLTVYGAFMKGTPITKKQLPKSGILVMGNEANGISKEIEEIIKEKISIESHPGSTTESLNVAMATGILLHEIRR